MIQKVSNAKVLVAGRPDRRYSNLPGISAMVEDHLIQGPFDLGIIVDGDQRRLSPHLAPVFQAATTRVIVDHHYSSRADGYDLALLDPGAASTCEIIGGLMARWGVELDLDTASLLYVGMVFDTGGFLHSNTSARTHLLAARLLRAGIDHSRLHVRVLMERSPGGIKLLGNVLAGASFHEQGTVLIAAVTMDLLESAGAELEDTVGIVDMLVYTSGVEVAILAVERKPRQVKLSLRSRGKVNVALVARSLDPGGGGHERAAGVVLEKPLARVLEWMPRKVANAVRHGSSASQEAGRQPPGAPGKP